jgi:hypothetical protein
MIVVSSQSIELLAELLKIIAHCRDLSQNLLDIGHDDEGMGAVLSDRK